MPVRSYSRRGIHEFFRLILISQPIVFCLPTSGVRNFGAGTALLEAHRQIAAFLNEQPFSSGSASPRRVGEMRTFTFSASQPVAIALRGFVNERSEWLMTTLPIAELSRPSSARSPRRLA